MLYQRQFLRYFFFTWVNPSSATLNLISTSVRDKYCILYLVAFSECVTFNFALAHIYELHRKIWQSDFPFRKLRKQITSKLPSKVKQTYNLRLLKPSRSYDVNLIVNLTLKEVNFLKMCSLLARDILVISFWCFVNTKKSLSLSR